MSTSGDPVSHEVPDAVPELAQAAAEAAPRGAYQGHLDELLTRFDRHARRAFHNCSEASLHELRVAYKMLRAALAPLRSPDPADPVRAAARPVRKLFRVAGPLRECHVHRQLLAVHMEEDEQSIPEWIHALTAREISARQRFLALAPAWKPAVTLQLSHVVLSATSTCDEPELEWRARSLFAVLASRLADVQQESDLSTVDLHRVRRLSKDARYVLGLVTALAPEEDPNAAELDSKLRDVHRALGGWHDATVACADLRDFLDVRSGASLRHPDLYAAYDERLAASADRHRTQFDGAWRRLLSALGVPA